MSVKRPARSGIVSGPADGSVPCPPNVVEFRPRVLPRHREWMARWLEAGRVMGLCDAQPYHADPHKPGAVEHVVIWVRESADPAYVVAADGPRWTVTDCVRDLLLARVRSFEEALNFIRPVLPLSGQIVAGQVVAGQPQWAPPPSPVTGARRARARRMSSPIDHA